MMAFMDTPTPGTAGAGLAAMALQLTPWLKKIVDRLLPLVDQPIIRVPYSMPLVNKPTGGIPAGSTNFVLTQSDFNHSLEWPFEIHSISFAQDDTHTAFDWRVLIRDQTFSQELMKAPVPVGVYAQIDGAPFPPYSSTKKLDFPWVVRPKGGGLMIYVDNLDTVGALNIDLAFNGYLLVPRTAG